MNFSFRSDCPISSALDIVGDKWSLLILRDMMFSRKQTFSEFIASPERIATNILTDRLSNLEKSGLIMKGKRPDNKKVNIYSLTEKGIGFLPVLVEVILWSHENLYDHISDQTKNLAGIILKDKEGFVQSYKTKLRKEVLD